MMVVDGGANMGGYSLLASRRAGAEGRIFAFEPDPHNYARLLKQVRHLTNVQPVQKAIAAASGESLLFLDTVRSLRFVSFPVPASHIRSLEGCLMG